MKIAHNALRLLPIFVATALAVSSAQAATVFQTNTSGNAAALQGVGATDVTELTLNGGGTINLTTIGVFNDTNAETLGMSATGMGVNNDRWGNDNQRWLFSFDEIISFDAIGFFAAGGSNHGLIIRSAAWKDDIVTVGSNWTFSSDDDFGTIAFNTNNGPAYDFTGSGLSNVAANTQIEINYMSGSGGASMSDFTLTVIPEPTTALLGGLGLLALLRRRR